MNRFRRALLAGMIAAATSSTDISFAKTRIQHSLRVSVPRSANAVHQTHVPHGRKRQYFPSPCTYTVKPSNTLWEIGQVSGITVSALKQENGLKSNTIYIGEHLMVPRKWRAYVWRSSRALPIHTYTDKSPEKAPPQRRNLMGTPHIVDAPANLIPVYKGAGSRFGIPWTVLAAIHKTETDFGISDCGVSSDGAMGPMQFMPSTFAAYAVKAPGQAGSPNIQDVDDAIYTAAHMLSQDGFSSDPANAIFAYNHSNAYVQQIEALAGLR